MPVYLVQAGGEGGPIKIGFAAKPWSRLVKMQVDNHEPLKIVRLLVGGKPEEEALQERFSHLRMRGEWFHSDPAMLGDLGLQDVPVVPPISEPGTRGGWKWSDVAREKQRVAQKQSWATPDIRQSRLEKTAAKRLSYAWELHHRWPMLYRAPAPLATAPGCG